MRLSKGSVSKSVQRPGGRNVQRGQCAWRRMHGEVGEVGGEGQRGSLSSGFWLLFESQGGWGGGLGSDLELKGYCGLPVVWEVGPKPGTLLTALCNNPPNQTMKQNHSQQEKPQRATLRFPRAMGERELTPSPAFPCAGSLLRFHPSSDPEVL